MQELERSLQQLFDEMLLETPHFKKKTYDTVFNAVVEKYQQPLSRIEMILADTPEEEAVGFETQMAQIIPDYAKSRMDKMTKRQKDNKAIDYNMTMAVYVVPALYAMRNEHWDRIAEQTVTRWNDLQVTSLNLSPSRYEDISGGFRKRLCFITTAVCENMAKPDDCYELELLRDYRDGWLAAQPEGAGLIEEYYEKAPLLVCLMNMQKNKDELYSSIYNEYITPCVKDIESGRRAECEERYVAMVRTLERKFLPV